MRILMFFIVLYLGGGCCGEEAVEEELESVYKSLMRRVLECILIPYMCGRRVGEMSYPNPEVMASYFRKEGGASEDELKEDKEREGEV
ncbi:hypothetical protein C922_04451 [Plasmodium inui San Antonio 1]|uniref:Uncharacterized protein n=1 Tax=Plasmodium inui San Antonio 1 TaxID=1237626 RepID=W7A0P4_9APIC|nr:hypothetical protein C922_04451 [Plasmodium inui San Antonio 1]EUD65165.1 hypothetical protein C922_04451 [Plasmodium inui San Antonio 1]